jgi:hypothetical protein
MQHCNKTGTQLAGDSKVFSVPGPETVSSELTVVLSVLLWFLWSVVPSNPRTICISQGENWVLKRGTKLFKAILLEYGIVGCQLDSVHPEHPLETFSPAPVTSIVQVKGERLVTL